MLRSIFKSLLMWVTLSASLFGHDMWIEPSAFRPAAGDIVSLKLKVGQDMLGDPLARDSRLIKQFVVVDAEGRKEVVGRDGGNPAGFIRASEAGLMVTGYYSNPSVVDETAEKFNQYLKEEGLNAIAALRARRNETDLKVREMFTRCAKTLVVNGTAPDRSDRVLGLPLELIVEKDHNALRLLYEGKPLAGTLVIAMNKQNPSEKISARTGADGRVRLKLQKGGMWMVKAVHMIPAAAGSGADWQSYWASTTFEMGDVVAVSAR